MHFGSLQHGCVINYRLENTYVTLKTKNLPLKFLEGADVGVGVIQTYHEP